MALVLTASGAAKLCSRPGAGMGVPCDGAVHARSHSLTQPKRTSKQGRSVGWFFSLDRPHIYRYAWRSFDACLLCRQSVTPSLPTAETDPASASPYLLTRTETRAPTTNHVRARHRVRIVVQSRHPTHGRVLPMRLREPTRPRRREAQIQDLPQGFLSAPAIAAPPTRPASVPAATVGALRMRWLVRR